MSLISTVLTSDKMESLHPTVKSDKPSRSSTQSSGSSSSSSSSSSTSSSSSSATDSDSSASSDDEQIDKEGAKNDVELVHGAIMAKQQHRQQKPQFLRLLRDNEKLQEELKRKQKKLLKINLDKYFLFERLLSYEKPPPRKYTKHKNTKPNKDIDTIIENDESCQNELSIRTQSNTSEKDFPHSQELLEVDIDTEEDTQKPNRISLLKRQINTSANITDSKSNVRKKYKKRKKTLPPSNEEEGNATSVTESQILPKGTSLLLPSFSAQQT